jgi:ABC-type transport system involved in cytochrome c biogenesis permease subunit
MAGVGGFLALLAAWSMSIIDGDTFAVLVAVLDTQFWLATHVVCISIGYGATLVAGFLGLAFVVQGLVTPTLKKQRRRNFSNLIYGVICFGLITSFFGTVLGGLWADDSWGRFWGWDPKENGAMMIVLWNAVSLHARWGGMIRERGLAALAIIGNLVTLWSWKGVNAMGVGLHAYAGTEDATMNYILLFGALSCVTLGLAMIPTRFWMSYSLDGGGKK